MPREKKPKQRTLSQMEPVDLAMAIDQWMEQWGRVVERDGPDCITELCRPVATFSRYQRSMVPSIRDQVRLRHIRDDQLQVLTDRLPWVYAKMSNKDPRREMPRWIERSEQVKPIFLYGHIRPIMALLVGEVKASTYFRALYTYRSGIGFQVAAAPADRRYYDATERGPWLNLYSNRPVADQE